MEHRLQDVVASQLARAGLERDPAALAHYLSLLARWGQRINLTGRPEAEHVARRLLPDSLRLATALAPHTRTVLDAGSGSGIVGLVLALVCPELQLHLVEPAARRCSFLRTAVFELGLRQLTLHEARLEQLVLPPHDLAVSRATWPPAQWLERASALVRVGGEAVCFLGAGPAPLASTGWRPSRTVHHELDDGTPRQLAFYQRT